MMQGITDTLAAGGRISVEQALYLASEAAPHTLWELARRDRVRRFGQDAFYVYNQHLNYTNICANACRFCAFSKRAGDPEGYTLTPQEAAAKVAERAAEPIREIHIVGGLNPDLPYSYYLDLLSGVKAARPSAAVKAFTAVEVAFLANLKGTTYAQVLEDMRGAGLDALPGGGAEVFSPELRKRLCPEKVSAEVWLEVHRTAHGMGIPTNATLLFGHIETWEDRIAHMAALRDLQDDTGGFLCFIPLAYQPGSNPLAEKDGAKGPDGLDYLSTIAISRLFLDNVPHLKAYWAFAGIKAAQAALHAGADDFDGTLVEEKVGHAAGAASPKGLTLAKLRTAIEMAGFNPVERGTDFNPC